jgi:hypothetical protein
MVRKSCRFGFEEVNEVAQKKVSPKKPAAKKTAASSKKAATRVTKKTQKLFKAT